MSNTAVIPSYNTNKEIVLKLAGEVRHWGSVFDRGATEARAAMWGAMQARLLCGAALFSLKKLVKHGEFEAIRAEQFPNLTERTAQLWKQRAESDLRNPDLREAVQAVLDNRDDAAAQERFCKVSEKYFTEHPTLQNAAASEMKLLLAPTPRAAVKPGTRKTPTQEAVAAAKQRELLGHVQTHTETLHVLGLDQSLKVFVRFAEEKPAEFKALRARMKAEFSNFIAKLDRIKA